MMSKCFGCRSVWRRGTNNGIAGNGGGIRKRKIKTDGKWKKQKTNEKGGGKIKWKA